MRVDVHKFLLFGPVSQKKEFFKKAQKLGCIEFIDHGGQKFDIVPDAVKKMNKALRILRGVAVTKQSELDDLTQAKGIAEEILACNARIDKLFEEKRLVNQEMSRVAVFGNFSRDDIDFIQDETGRVIQFFFSKNKESVPDHPELIYVGKDHDLHYYISINKEKTTYEHMVEMVVDHSYGELLNRKKEIETTIRQLEYRIKELATFRSLIKEAVIQEFNHYYLMMNQNFVDYHCEEAFFSAQVWISEDKIKEVKKLIDSFSIYMTEIAVEVEEKRPTHLVNEGTNRIGEDLIYIYDTPSTQDKDPSGWVLWAFALFFAFIVGDGGYGVVFLLLALVMRWKIKKPSPAVTRINKLLGILSISCILWGFFVSSFFGIDLNISSSLKRYSPVSYLVEQKLAYHMSHQDETYKEFTEQFPHLKTVRMPYEFLTQAVKVKDGQTEYVVYNSFANNVMLELALFIGVVHLMLSMLRGMGQSWARLGWIFFLIGAYLYFPDILNATSLIHYAFGVKKIVASVIGPYILLGGIALAMILAIIQNKMGGISEVMNVVTVFADVLSYLRLYALALAGSIMANTFNMFGSQMPIYFGILVILIGHSLNIVLSVMGGVIHGLRLNFLEWYHYSFEGDGKKHKPLALLQFRK